MEEVNSLISLRSCWEHLFLSSLPGPQLGNLSAKAVTQIALTQVGNLFSPWTLVSKCSSEQGGAEGKGSSSRVSELGMALLTSPFADTWLICYEQ